MPGRRSGARNCLARSSMSTPGALWRRDWIEAARVAAPPSSSHRRRRRSAGDGDGSSDACGIVVAGLGADGRAYVLADRNAAGARAVRLGARGVAAYRDFAADRVVAEVNQGGDLVEARRCPDRPERAGAQGPRDARQVAARRTGRGSLRRRAASPRRALRRARGPDVRVGADGLAAAAAPTARRARLGDDRSDARDRAPPRVRKL